MNRTTKARLERKGWRVGSATDFLGLSAQEAALVEMKVALSRFLKDLRAKRNLSQHQFARVIGSSQSRVAKMEAGDRTVSVDLLLRSLFAIGARLSDLARVISLARRIRKPPQFARPTTRT